MNDRPISRSSDSIDAFSIEDWQVDASTLRVSKDGKSEKLEPRTMEVLMYLADRPGETISREELEREVWGGQVVVYEALSNTITKLRKAFEDDPSEPRIIQTIPKVGYRLIGEVTRSVTKTRSPMSAAAMIDGMTGSKRWYLSAGIVVLAALFIAAALLRPALWHSREEPVNLQGASEGLLTKPSIAVLPFTNMSGDPGQEYFADGMVDDLITDLSKVSGLLVISRNATFKYKGIVVNISRVARELGVQYVLEGSVRRDEERVRINVQLIDAATIGHVWAERYDSSLDDIFALQDKVTASIVAALAVNLTVDEMARRERKETDSPRAYEALLRGRARYNLGSSEDFAKAVSHLHRALELDPDYSRAHGMLAASYYRAWSNYDTEALGLTMDQADQKVRAHLKEAMKNPTVLAHTTASWLLTGDLRFDEAVEEAKHAVALNPSDDSGYTALARIAAKANRPADALAAIEMALLVNPRGNDSGEYLWRVGQSEYLLGRYDEAVETMLTSLELSDDYWAYFVLGAAYGQLGRDREAKVAVDKFNERWMKKGRRPFTLAHLDGWALAPRARELYKEGLRKAGMLPGGSTSPVLAGVHTAPLEVEGATTITVVEAKSLFDTGVPFVDVRGKDNDWKSGRIPRAVHLHMYHDLSEANLASAVDKDEAVVIYAGGTGSSQSGRASARAAIWGFKKVSYLRDGFPAWKEAGYPIETPSE